MVSYIYESFHIMLLTNEEYTSSMEWAYEYEYPTPTIDFVAMILTAHGTSMTITMDFLNHFRTTSY